MVMSQFITGKTPDIEFVQIFIEFQSVLKIRSKSASYIIVYIHLGIQNRNIKKENIEEQKWQNKLYHNYMTLVYNLVTKKKSS